MVKMSRLQMLVKTVKFYGRFAPSFTRIGYIARGLPFRPVRARYTGQTWLVTGATGGLGAAAALAAARKGARVFAIGRNAAALAKVAGQAADLSGAIIPVCCDLSSVAAITALHREGPAAGIRYDVLVNNVGVLLHEFGQTSEGVERSYATNLLGHYVLTEELFAAGLLNPGAAIINVVSGGMYNAPLNTTMLDMAEATYNGFAAYASHKRAQLALTDHWREAFGASGIQTYAVHPGWADTAGVQSSLPTFRKILAPILRSPREGADTIDWLAANRPPEATDQVWFDRKPRSAHAYARTRERLASPEQLIAFLRNSYDRVRKRP